MTAPSDPYSDEQGPACVLAHPEPVAATDGLCCRRHFGWITATLREIAELFAHTTDVLIPGPGTGERQGTRTGSPAPGRIGVMALTDHRGIVGYIDDDDAIPDVPGALYSWVRLAAEEMEEAADTEKGREYARDVANINGDVQTIVHRLLRERRWISRQAWVDDYAADLAVLHKHVAAAVGESMWPRPIGRCPNQECGANLYPTVGVDIVKCGRCKTMWTGANLIRLQLIHEQAAKERQA